MAVAREVLPLMVLAEDGDRRQVYAYRAGRWAVFTLLLGLGLLAGALWAQFSGPDSVLLLIVLYAGSALLLYSTAFSMYASQWLMFDGESGMVRFHKKNFYGGIDWERPGGGFTTIKVFRRRQQRNWTILLETEEGLELFLGENLFGSLDGERARKMAQKAASLVGVGVDYRPE